MGTSTNSSRVGREIEPDQRKRNQITGKTRRAKNISLRNTSAQSEAAFVILKQCTTTTMEIKWTQNK